LEIIQIKSTETYPLRKEVLRPNGIWEDCIFEGDDNKKTFHLGAFKDGRLVSISSFYFENHLAITEKYQYRLRGMATHPRFQKKGFSSQLLKTAFPIIIKNSGSIIWCNARESAIGFYEKLGFKIIGDRFEILRVGPHYLMKKELI
jgi:GNAT superfamily N-acetyltransferase